MKKRFLNVIIENRLSKRGIYQVKYKSNDTHQRKTSNLGKVINLKNNSKAQSFKGYEIWAKQHNLKNMAKTLNLITIHQINSRDELYNAISKTNIELTNTATDIKNIENDIGEIGFKIKNIETYNRLKTVYSAYQVSKDRDSFYKAHADEIILFEAAITTLGATVSEDILDIIPVLKRELNQRIVSKEKSYKEYQQQKEKVSQLNFLKSNLETYMQWQEPDFIQKREH